MVDPTHPNMAQNQIVLSQLVGRAGQLYTLPAVAMELLDLTATEGVDAEQLKTCLERDPALVAKILRVVNSSLFGLSRPVGDLKEALALLGIKPLKLLVLGFSLPEGLFLRLAGDVLRHYWQTALTKAVAARQWCELLERCHGDEAFLAGLLQDIGLLVLLEEVGEPFVEFVGRVQARGLDLPAVERDVLGFDHTELTSELLKRWRLPETLVTGVKQLTIEQALEAPESTRAVAQSVTLAGIMVRIVVDQRTEALAELNEALDICGLKVNAERLTSLTGQIQQFTNHLAEALRVPFPIGADAELIMRRAHAQLVAAAEEAAGAGLVSQQKQLAAKIEEFKLLEEVRELSQTVAQVAVAPVEPLRPRNHKMDNPHAAQPMALAVKDAPTTTDGPARKRRAEHKTAAAPPSGGDDPVALAQVAMAAITCRQRRISLSVLLVQLDQHEGLLFALGAEAAEHLMAELGTLCETLDVPGVQAVLIREGRYVVMLPDCDRQEAVRVAAEILDAVGGLPSAAGKEGVSVSIGAATVGMIAKNFAPQSLVSAADRCLYGAQAFGGGTIKSIEIF